MPKHTRSSSSNQNRYSNPMPVSLAPSAPMPIYSTRQQQQQQQLSLNTGYYSALPSSASAQASMQAQQQTYDPYPAASVVVAPQPPTMPHRASSGAWTPQDDQNLLQARQQGLNWAQIQSSYFPNKTPNACRKRHERLMERKGADDWDQRKLERMAKEYMSLRKEIWQPLAQRTGEKWNVVESMCMNNGLKNLQSAARSASRRERLETGAGGGGHPMHGYGDDDSGISGIGLTPVDDQLNDASYSSPETCATSSSGGSHHSSSSGGGSHSVGGYGSAYQMALNGHHPHHHTAYGTAAQGYTTTGGSSGALSSSFSSSHSSNAAYHPHSHHHHHHHQHPDEAAYMANGQRLPSVDMGIEAIINRPAHHNGGPSI